MNEYSTPLQIRDKGFSFIPVTAYALQSMEIFDLMSLGLFLGMTHAMDADHIAAVSAIWSRQGGKQAWINQRWLYWGAGHAIVACRCARHYFWQSVFGDNSLSLPVD